MTDSIAWRSTSAGPQLNTASWGCSVAGELAHMDERPVVSLPDYISLQAALRVQLPLYATAAQISPVFCETFLKRQIMSSADVEQADVVVAGGGPGGSTLASLVAMQGHRVVILDMEKFPRYQIGESLLPATIHGICRLIGVADDLADANFVRKRGGTFRWGANPEPWTFSFAVSPNMTTQTSYAYQVERSKFDQILLENARRSGAEIREQCTVTDVMTDGNRVCGVTYLRADGTSGQIQAKYVVDASGNKSRIYKHTGGTRKYSEFFRSVALFAYFEGGKRLPPPKSGNILSVAFDSGWFWYIPLSEQLTSVGAVVRQELANKIQGNPEQAFRALVDECPLISDYLSSAKRLTDGPYGQFRVRKDYSYHNTKVWRPGLVLIGDAACFVDPVFSSGVHLATYSALLAARSINSVLANLMDERTVFDEFERRYRREYGVFYKFLMAFYDMNANEKSYFWSAKKLTGSTHAELESFADLVGGMSSGETALTGAVASARGFEDQSKAFSDAVDQIVADKEQSMLPMLRTKVVQQAMMEGTQVQSLATLGVDADGEAPLFKNGLVPSADGVFWAIPDPVPGKALRGRGA